ncbi:hypothetical protein [Spirobacillus cienkowskii]|jgi:hypothetical protein|uniref:Uncharacterized protein n=1 Tax=Spirobacillus cienkowskii TaxID=495820 RepID=A0A369KP30_9BACT|nr:MAG: hypothetical protein DCC88_10730 [Spirobacillus cienkowskii]
MIFTVLKKTIIFLLYGLVWLFIFSIPAKNDEKVFYYFHDKIVDSKPVHWLLNKFNLESKKTENKVLDTANKVLDNIKKEIND